MTLYKGAKLHLLDDKGEKADGYHALFEVEDYGHSSLNGDVLIIKVKVIK